MAPRPPSGVPDRSLRELHAELSALGGRNGPFIVVCDRTGDRPFPARGLRFPDRETAEAAVDLTITYRNRLRRWDSMTPYYDPIVTELPRVDDCESRK